MAVLRGRQRTSSPSGILKLRNGDIVILQGEPTALARVVSAAKLKLLRDEAGKEIDTPADDIGLIEGIVTPQSPLVDNTPASMRLCDHFQVNLLAVSRAGKRISHQLRSVRFKAGDVIMLQGNLNSLPETLGELRVLPLAERGLLLGRGQRGFIPVAVLVAAMMLVAFGILPIAVAFFAATVVILMMKTLSLREAYDAVEWPILIMLAVDFGIGCVAHNWRHRPYSRLAKRGGNRIVADWYADNDHGGSIGGNALSEQCRDRTGNGSNRCRFR